MLQMNCGGQFDTTNADRIAMTEQTKLLVIDIEPRNNCNAVPDVENNNRTRSPLWKRSDNSFQFDFVPPAQLEETAPSDLKPQPQPSRDSNSTNGQTLGFAFNFPIPAGIAGQVAAVPVSPASSEASSTTGRQCSSEEQKLKNVQKDSQTSEPPASSKAKKKKKSAHKKKEAMAGQQIPSSTAVEGANGDDGTHVLTAEQQLNRELDWCIEQLELGMRTQKGTPKQKEEAFRALKTLRSSKAPLAKKRQVMRAMSGDYRKKMEEDKERQFKLIQAAVTSAQVTAVSEPPKKSIFHRSVDSKVHTQSKAEGTQQGTPNRSVQSQQTSTFVLIPSKEEFQFNFI